MKGHEVMSGSYETLTKFPMRREEPGSRVVVVMVVEVMKTWIRHGNFDQDENSEYHE